MNEQTTLSEAEREDKEIEKQMKNLKAKTKETLETEVKAEKLFEEFKEVSVTEFFRKNKSHLGYSGKLRSLTTVIHELVTNSLDACEEAGILPNIIVEINELGKEHYRIIERDSGPGIPKKHVTSVFGKMLAGTKFHRNIQLRGQQGIGVAGVTMFSQMTTGKPIKITTSTGNGKVNEINLMIDVTKNDEVLSAIMSIMITGKGQRLNAN